jgi:leucine dehydrogenase
MKAVSRRLWDTTDLAGRHVVVSGVGKVGYALVRHLVEERATVTVADVSQPALDRACKDLGVDATPVETAHALPCDLYSPCAMGKALNAETIPALRCAAVVGSANNQLADESCIGLLADAGVLYAPDYVVNAGGVINIAEELHGYHRERAYANVRRIGETLTNVFAAADAEGIPTAVAADRLAERRIAALSEVQLLRTFPAAMEERR